MRRIVLPNYPHHVVQRGHNRQVVFAEPSDYQRYLEDLRELKTLFFCLMTNHVHLLLAPGNSAAGLGQLMKGLAGRATRYRNKLEGRTGTLWESRYKSSVVQTDAYLLACSRYIELNRCGHKWFSMPEITLGRACTCASTVLQTTIGWMKIFASTNSVVPMLSELHAISPLWNRRLLPQSCS
jgi:REP element-mobilizing transposase RayT